MALLLKQQYTGCRGSKQQNKPISCSLKHGNGAASWLLVLLLVLLWCTDCVGQGPSAFLAQTVKKAGKRASRVVEKAGGKVLDVGSIAGSRLGKASSTAVYAGVKAARAALSENGTVVRVSQRTWEGAKAATRAAQAAYGARSQQQQAQQEQQAPVDDLEQHGVHGTQDGVSRYVNPIAAGGTQHVEACSMQDGLAPPSSTGGTQYTAAAGGASASLKLTGEGLVADSIRPAETTAHISAARGPREGTAASTPTPAAAAAAAPASAATSGRPTAPAPSTHPTAHVSRQPSSSAAGSTLSGGLSWLLTHLAALVLGWLLHAITAAPQQQQHAQGQKQQGQQAHSHQRPEPAAAGEARTAASHTSSRASSSRRQQQRLQPMRPAGVGAAQGSTAATTPAAHQQQPGDAGAGTAPGGGPPAGVAAAARERPAGTAPAPAGDVMEAGADDSRRSSSASSSPASPSAASQRSNSADEREPAEQPPAPIPISRTNSSSSSSGSAGLDEQRPVQHAPRRHAHHRAGGVVLCRRRPGAPGARAGHRQLVAHQQLQQQQLAVRPQGVLQQPVQVIGHQTTIITHNKLVVSDEVAGALLPIARAVQKASEAVQQLADVGRRLMGWHTAQEAAQQLAAQQDLFMRAGHWGQLLGLVVLAAVALRAGRVWEVHQVCSLQSLRPDSWRARMLQWSGMPGVAGGVAYINCCAQQLGLYAGALLAVYLLLRISWAGLSGQGRTAGGGGPSNAYQLDLVVVKGVVCSWLGVHVVHCLGGAWVLWLAGWLLWCGLQLRLNSIVVGKVQSSLCVLLVAVVLPGVMCWGAFAPTALLMQGSIMEALPWLRRLTGLIPWGL